MTKIKLNREWSLGVQFDDGGFGRIYLGTSDAGEEVVIKLVPKDPGADRELLFESISDLPNIIPILDTGEWNDSWVLVMPKAEKSLRIFLEEQSGPIPSVEAVQILIDIATALSGLEDIVVYRDLKPGNILLYEGRWCLTDFGIARYSEATTAPDTRKFFASQPYAAPEQWRAERATRAVDVYALGIVGYEMLAGEQPFPGPADHDYRDQHLNTDAPIAPNCTAPLRALIAECLYKAPQARPNPGNLLARLEKSLVPASPAAQRLQQANLSEVQREATREAERSVIETESERRTALFNTAEAALRQIYVELYESILENAPLATHQNVMGTSTPEWILNLSDAVLTAGAITKRPRYDSGKYTPDIDVIASSVIDLSVPIDSFGYDGRSHSLWYGDVQEKGEYRWFETAFMFNPLSSRGKSHDPFAMAPAEEAYLTISGISGGLQLAWPFTAIDQGAEGDFIEYWLERFADAALGNLRHPGSMPERPPKGSWRRS